MDNSCVRRDYPLKHTSRSDNNIISNLRSLKNRNAPPAPNVVTYDHGRCYIAGKRSISISSSVIVVIYHTIGAKRTSTPYFNCFPARYYAIEIKKSMTTYLENSVISHCYVNASSAQEAGCANSNLAFRPRCTCAEVLIFFSCFLLAPAPTPKNLMVLYVNLMNSLMHFMQAFSLLSLAAALAMPPSALKQASFHALSCSQ